MFSPSTSLSHVMRNILSLWIKPEKIEKDYAAWEFKPHQHVFYVIENHSFVDALVADQHARDLKFPSLFRHFDFGSIQGNSAFLNLHSRKSRIFPKKPTIAPRLKALVDHAIAHPEDDILLIPVTLIWGRGPIIKKSVLQTFLSDAWDVTGRFKKLVTVLLNGRNTYIEFNTPILIQDYVTPQDQGDRSVRKLARVLRVHFRRSKTRVIGPDLSHRRALMDLILKTPAVQAAVKEHAESNNQSIETTSLKAFEYGREIAANLSITTIRALYGLLTRLWHKIYDGIAVNNFEPVRELAKSTEIIYAPCHRSHIDYLLLSYSLYRRGLNLPHIAAGVNLNLPIVGNILRRGGAFFMRRSMKDNPLYSAVFQEYIHQVFAHGHPVEYFIEGGRSRTGKTLQPKTGMLSMTVRSFLADNSRPVVIVPVYIGYEKVFEDRTYLKELQGIKKEKESLWALLKTLRKLKNFGEVALNFGKPIHLDQFLDTHNADWRSFDTTDKRPAWLVSAVNQLAIDVVTGINSAAALNPVNLVACVLLSSPKNAVGETMLLNQLQLLSNLITLMPYSDTLSLPKGTPQDWVREVEKRGWLDCHRQDASDVIYSLNDENAILMTYYRNNVMHLFAVPALLCSLFSNDGKLRKKDAVTIASRIYPYLRAELFLPFEHQEFGLLVGRWLDVLFEQKVLAKNKAGFFMAHAPSTVDRASMSLMAQLILPTLERYFLTLSLLSHFGSGKVTAAHLEVESQSIARRIGILYRLNAPEFFDKALFRQFIQTLTNRNVITVDSDGQLYFDERIQAVMNDADKALGHTVMMTISQLLDEYRHREVVAVSADAEV